VGFWATVPYYTLFSNQAQYHKKTNSTDLQVNLSNKSLISRLLLQKHGTKLNQAKKKASPKMEPQKLQNDLSPKMDGIRSFI
jgi:hypothetical protein